MPFDFAGITIPDVKTDTLAKHIAENFPSVWKRCYTKHYDAPGAYRSFKYVAVQFAMGLIGDADAKARNQDLVTNIPVLYKILEEYDWPTYHVHGAMLAAMRRTHPPKGRTWEDINLPYPGVIFMIPRGSLNMPPLATVPGSESIPLAYIGIARVSRTRFKFLSDKDVPDADDRICVFWSADTPNEGPVSHDCAFPVTQSLEPDSDWINSATGVQHDKGYMSSDIVEGKYTSVLAGVIANLLMLREARPEYIEHGVRNTGRKLGNGTSIHAPTFIGRRYVVKHESGSAASLATAGRFTELGWRAGHMKAQPCGPALKERRTIWVEPYMAHVRGLKYENTDGNALAASKQSLE